MNPVGLVARKGYPQESVVKTIFFGSSPRHVNLDYDVSGKHVNTGVILKEGGSNVKINVS